LALRCQQGADWSSDEANSIAEAIQPIDQRRKSHAARDRQKQSHKGAADRWQAGDC
jgi:hypothetical protein